MKFIIALAISLMTINSSFAVGDGGSIGGGSARAMMNIGDFSNVKAIKLFDDSIINAKQDIKYIQFSDEEVERIEFLELKDNSIIDSSDITKFYFKASKINLGDGSGG